MDTVMGSLLGRKFLGHSTVVDGQLEGDSSTFCDVLKPNTMTVCIAYWNLRPGGLDACTLRRRRLLGGEKTFCWRKC